MVTTPLCVCLLSGGIDSPVAAQIAVNNGYDVLLLHYHNYPFHSLGTLEKVVELANALKKNNPRSKISLAIMPHGKSQEALLNLLVGKDHHKLCLFCRILMYKKAEAYARKKGAVMIITGEILGEQASQTAANLPIVESLVGKDILRVKPLLAYNKKEVVELSTDWGYYEISKRPGGCCSVNPKNPVVSGNIQHIHDLFNRLERQLTPIIAKEIEEVIEYSLPIEVSKVLQEQNY